MHVDCVADHYKRYSGEPVILFVRVTLHTLVDKLRVAIELPAQFVLEQMHTPSQWPQLAADLERVGDLVSVAWESPQNVSAGVYEFTVQGAATPIAMQADEPEHELRFAAEARIMHADWTYWSHEGVSIAIINHARYLRYLPSLYRDDETMGRFLMLFESFWRPIEQQIDHIDDALDPRMTPSALLPWLASWVDMKLDPNWDEDKQRRLLRACVALYRRRGTYNGLKEFLEIYTGVVPNIIEHRASNMRLRSNAILGQGIAIGRNNVPNGLTIQLRLPGLPEAEATLRRQIIESIIEAEKPAHATYRLLIEESAPASTTTQIPTTS